MKCRKKKVKTQHPNLLSHVFSNLTAKHALQFNKSATFKDRKKANKKGYSKHKKQWPDPSKQNASIRSLFSSEIRGKVYTTINKTLNNTFQFNFGPHGVVNLSQTLYLGRKA